MPLAFQNSYIVMYFTWAVMLWCILQNSPQQISEFSCIVAETKLCFRFIREITHWKQIVMKAVFFFLESVLSGLVQVVFAGLLSFAPQQHQCYSCSMFSRAESVHRRNRPHFNRLTKEHTWGSPISSMSQLLWNWTMQEDHLEYVLYTPLGQCTSMLCIKLAQNSTV